MRSYLFLLMSLLFITCKNKNDCKSFTTAEELAAADLVKCKADSMFFYMQDFSLAFNDKRKELDIPLLPEHFIAVTYTVDNQIRWQDDGLISNRSYGKAYMHHKDLEWDKNNLRYDRTSFYANDSLKQAVGVIYWLDTVTNSGQYKTDFYYRNKHYPGDSSHSITREQTDSVLKAWGLAY